MKELKREKIIKNGFTLIELLAVIIILGILMIIAIPSVTRYISDSRKSAYATTAKEIVAGARNIVNDGKLGMFDTNTTYYIPSSYIKTENASKSPYGEFTEAYVVITYNGKGYSYYWTSVDDAGEGIKDIVAYDKLETDNVESDLTNDMIDPNITKRGVGERSKILVLDPNTETWKEVVGGATTKVPEEGSGQISNIIPDPVSFSTDSWATISNAVKNGNIDVYQVGDEKEITLSNFGTFNVRIANKSNPGQCSNINYSQSACGFVVEFVDIIDLHIYNPRDLTYTGGIYGKDNVGGWEYSSIREYISTVIYDALPKDLKDVIISTRVISGHGATPQDNQNYVTNDKLYIFSAKEILNTSSAFDTAASQTKWLDYYQNKGNSEYNYDASLKNYNGTPKAYWLRAAHSENKNNFQYCYGYWSSTLPNQEFGIAPAFRLG